MNRIICKIVIVALSICLSSSAVKFTREAGFWSNQQDELKTDFLGKLTDPKSQREDWYKVTPYSAEFWCTISNLGFIYTGIKNKSPEIVFAGAASIVSHSIPKQWLLYVDKIGVLIALSRIVREYKFIIQQPKYLLLAGAAGLINIIDAYCARNYAQTMPHVFWHISAALLTDYFLKKAKDFNENL